MKRLAFIFPSKTGLAQRLRKLSFALLSIVILGASPACASTFQSSVQQAPNSPQSRFEVATINPTNPDQHQNGIKVRGRHILLLNKTVSELIAFSYGVQNNQIESGSAWISNDRYDIDGVSNIEGEPSLKQMQEMIRDLLATRFSLRLQKGSKNLPVYSLLVAKSGSKLTHSTADPNSQPDQTGSSQGMKFTNMSMSELALALQFIVGRPVLDKTELQGRFDFSLSWTPGGVENDRQDAPPGFFTAIQEQLGLRLIADHSQVETLIVENLEHPSPN